MTNNYDLANILIQMLCAYNSVYILQNNYSNNNKWGVVLHLAYDQTETIC